MHIYAGASIWSLAFALEILLEEMMRLHGIQGAFACDSTVDLAKFEECPW
jgi:hypothetical protein